MSICRFNVNLKTLFFYNISLAGIVLLSDFKLCNICKSERIKLEENYNVAISKNGQSGGDKYVPQWSHQFSDFQIINFTKVCSFHKYHEALCTFIYKTKVYN